MRTICLVVFTFVSFATVVSLFGEKRNGLPWDGKGEVLPWDGLDSEKEFRAAVDRSHPDLEFGFYFWNGDWAIGALEDFENDRVLLAVFNNVAGEGSMLRNGEEVILFQHNEATLKIASEVRDLDGSHSDYAKPENRIIGHWIDLEDTDQFSMMGQIYFPLKGTYKVTYDPDHQWKMSFNIEGEKAQKKEAADAYFSSRKPLLDRVLEVLTEKEQCLVRVDSWCDVVVTSQEVDPFGDFAPYRVIIGKEIVSVDESGSVRKESPPELLRNFEIHKAATDISGYTAELLVAIGSKTTDESFRSCLKMAGETRIKNVRVVIDEKGEEDEGLKEEEGGEACAEKNPGASVPELYEQGEEHFFAGRIADSIKAWDQEIELMPRREPYHWQRGIAYYYAGEFEKGVKQFELHQKVNGNDVENAVWHFICGVRAEGGSLEKARKSLIPIEGDTRIPMKEVHDLFAGTGTVEDVLAAADKGNDAFLVRNQRCYAHLCLGLYHEAIGEAAKSRANMKKAAVDFRMDHYMGKVAQLHERLRRKKPNIIFLFADDQRADTIAAHGNDHIQTPHLDQLVERGFSFRNNYCAGSFSGAVCVASRAMLMTGRHWMKLPKKSPGSNWGDAVLLPEQLTKAGGYRSHIIGKWHNGAGTLRKAFSEGSSVYMGGMANHADFEVQDYQEGKLSAKRPAGGFSSEVFANDAIKFIEGADEKDPFFLYVAFMAPHDPRNPPEKYREIYYKNRPPLPQNFLPQHPYRIGPSGVSGRDEGLAPWPRTKEMISDQLCEYYGLVTHLDEQVGRIMKALEGSPHADNTYIVYTADHGLAMGSHGLLGKQNVYEQSMKCPLIIWGPGVPAGQSSEAFSYVHDLYDTVLGMAGVSSPDGDHSQDLGPVMQGEKKVLHETVFLPFQSRQRTIRDARWKLHVYPESNHQLLFDLKTDPHEMMNLAEEKAYAEKRAEMIALMEKSRVELGDTQHLSVKNPQPKEAVYDNDKRSMDVWQPKWIRDKYFDGRDDPNHGPRRRKK